MLFRHPKPTQNYLPLGIFELFWDSSLDGLPTEHRNILQPGKNSREVDLDVLHETYCLFV